MHTLLACPEKKQRSWSVSRNDLVHMVCLLSHLSCLMSSDAHLLHAGTAENMNQWRSTTLAILRKDAPASLATQTERIVEHVVQQVNNILTSMSDIQLSEARDQSLRALLASSIDLSRTLRVQKAIFSISMPIIEAHQRTVFDAESMEDIGGEDEDSLNDREIQCVTFPGIVKTGDENGEKTHLKNVVAKIRVLCAPD
jgi:activating signal cointegrator complex subunit 1